MRVFILAGGLGTRIRSEFPDVPKPLIPVCGKPFLERQILLLAAQGFKDFTLCLGYRASQIKEYSIGIEVFGKPETFDPRSQSIQAF